MRSAWRRSYPGLIAIFLFTAVVNILKLAIPIYILQLLDRVLSSRSIDTLIMLTVITLIALMAGALIAFIRRWMLMRWGVWIERGFGKTLFMRGLTGNSPTRPSKSLRDLATLRTFVSGTGATAWLDVVWAPIFVIVVYLIHPAMALIAMIGIACMFLLGLLNEVMTRNARREASKATMENRDWVATAERNVETIGSLNIASHLADRWSDSAQTRLHENLWTRLNTLAIADTMKFIESVQRVASYAIGIWLVITGALSVGGVIAAAVLARIASSSVRRAMSSWRRLNSALAAYRRVTSRLSEGPDEQELNLDLDMPLALHIQGLAHRYPDQQNSVFRRISLSISPGEILCVIGPAGSGKSTFTKLVTGSTKARSGVVRLGEVDIARYSDQQLAQYIGYLQQDVKLFRGTIAENIAGMGELRSEDIVEAAKLASIHDRIVDLPLGYETELDEDLGYLSGSERKRIALARAYCHPARLIVLDEPEANLDGNARKALSEALLTCKSRGCIVVVTSQSKSLASIADKVIVLDQSSRAKIYQDETEIGALQNKRGGRGASKAITGNRGSRGQRS